MSSLGLKLRFFGFLLLLVGSLGLDTDGILLLSFKYSVLSDPLLALDSWDSSDDTPCLWRGVACAVPSVSDTRRRVVSLALPSCRLLGSIPANLGDIEHLRALDLSKNSLNGSLPASLFNASELQTLDLSNNLISGELPPIGRLGSLASLNLSDNALAGPLPENLTALNNLTVISLRSNYFSGNIRGGANAVRFLDLSANLINGSLPSDFGGGSLDYLNVSYNRISGRIPPEFAAGIPGNATVDFSNNNLSGEIPDSGAFYRQAAEKAFDGNPNLCGKPLKILCPIPSSPYNGPTSSPAIAAFPSSIPDALPPGSVNGSKEGNKTGGLKPGSIVGIVVGDVAGVVLLALTFLYIFQKRKKHAMAAAAEKKKKQGAVGAAATEDDWSSSSSSSSESRGITTWSCLRKRGEEDEESSGPEVNGEEEEGRRSQRRQGALVTVDGGEKELEVERLLRASAYILGATGGSILYKAVLEDGTALAVRRIGESGVDKFRDFEAQVRAVAKLVHPNLVRVRGFYWGDHDKLIIYDFVPNGSLQNARYRKVGSSPCHLPLDVRLKIARGIARGLTYLHDKKHVHGNLKPSNILLGSEMEPKLGDFGLEKLASGDTSYKMGGSMRIFGSKRSTASRDSFQDQATGPSPSPSPSPSSIGCMSPYHAPESLRSLKPNPKWDVYAFGVLLLELLTGKIVNLEDALDQVGHVGPALSPEDKNRVLRMADMAIRADVEGKEDALLACLRLGFSCTSHAAQKRPSMREALQVLEKMPWSSPSLHR